MTNEENTHRQKAGRLKITQERMVGIVRYAIRTDGLDAARGFFEMMNKYCSVEQGWSETAREIRDIFADERERRLNIMEEERQQPYISINNVNGDNNTTTNMEGSNARYMEIHRK